MKSRSLRAGAWIALGFSMLVACGDDPSPTFPVAVAPPSRHDDLAAAVETDTATFPFRDGAWLDDVGLAPFYGAGWLVRHAGLSADEATRRDAAVVRARALLTDPMVVSGAIDVDITEKMMACLGLIERVSATGDTSDVALIDDFIGRLDAVAAGVSNYLAPLAPMSPSIQTLGPTAVTALVGFIDVQYALLVGGAGAGARVAHAQTIDQAITNSAFGDLVNSRGFVPTPDDQAFLDLTSNVMMILLEGRLYRLTKDPDYLLEVRSLYGAIQPLKLSDAPARYESPYEAMNLGATTNDVLTLTSQNALALALLVLFEITGQESFVDEADRVFDGIAAMRGPWCLSQVNTAACAPVCPDKQVCVASACAPDACQTGLLDHIVDGRLAMPGDPTLFTSGASWQTLYVLGYRRALANQPW